MAQITWGIALGAKVESSPGTAETAPTGALTLADGIVLGDAGSGIGESGIDFGLERVDKDVAPVSNSFTAQFPSFIRRDVAKLSITVQGKGSGVAASNPTVNADFNQATDYPGLDALLRSAGLAGAAIVSGVGWVYKPASAASTTIWVWVGTGTTAVLYTIYSCTSKLSMAITPGDIPLWTFEIEGTLSGHDASITMPTFAYGTAASVSGPVIAEANHSFGLTGGMAVRGFSDMAITIDNQTEDVPDSNAVGGLTKRQTGRAVSLTATLYADDANEDYEDDGLAATVAPTDDVVFRAGLATAISAAAVNWNVKFNNPVVKKNEVAKLGPSVARNIELQATGTGTTEALSEFNLIFY